MEKMGKAARKGGLRLIQGTRDEVEVKRKSLGELAILVGGQWAGGQIGAKGERKLINALKTVMPGQGDLVVRKLGPAILEKLGQEVMEGEEGDNDCTYLLAHLLIHMERKTPVIREPVVAQDLDLDQIKSELGLISKNWGFSVDQDGHYIDITAQPQMPTGMGFDGEDAAPQYDEVNVAVIYLEEPKTELGLNAKFICLAPARIARLIEMVEAKR